MLLWRFLHMEPPGLFNIFHGVRLLSNLINCIINLAVLNANIYVRIKRIVPYMGHEFTKSFEYFPTYGDNAPGILLLRNTTIKQGVSQLK